MGFGTEITDCEIIAPETRLAHNFHFHIYATYRNTSSSIQTIITSYLIERNYIKISDHIGSYGDRSTRLLDKTHIR